MELTRWGWQENTHLRHWFILFLYVPNKPEVLRSFSWHRVPWCQEEFFLFWSLLQNTSLQYLLEVSRAIRRKRSEEAIRIHRGEEG